MDTVIGHNLRKQPARAWCAIVIALVVIAADFCSVTYQLRIVFAIASTFLLILLARGDRGSLGITFRMTPGYRYWVKVTLLIGVAVGAFCLVGYIVLRLFGVGISIPAIPPDEIVSSLMSLCVVAPILEEAVYRFVLCAPLAAVAGPRFTILLSGAVFAAIHFVHGNASPDNFIAGYFLTWAYLKSESILTPILLHSLGNACALAASVACWYSIS